ncbi:MAG: preprotein translocase subunit SecD [Oscillospiraceae bacterium]
MKKKNKWVFFTVFISILFLFTTSIIGIDKVYGDTRKVYIKSSNDIRWGIDIRGGVDATFVPDTGEKATKEQMMAIEEVIKQRLIGLNITDSEVYTDIDKGRVIVRFPWKEDEENFNPKEAIDELGQTAKLTFRKGSETNDLGQPTGVTAENVILEGNDISSAFASIAEGNHQYAVSLELSPSGRQKFSDATTELVKDRGTISIWMDDQIISAPTVNAAITDGKAIISGDFDAEQATKLANQINSGALPFALKTENFNTISPTLGQNSMEAMVIAGVISYIIISILIISLYRLPGFIASIALLGQIGLSIAAVSGYFGPFSSFTLTLPGIAGIILAIGFGVDANIITAERIKEEIKLGKSIDGSIQNGFKRGFSAIIDGNITIVIVAIILLAAFGPPDSALSKLFNPVFFIFGTSTVGAIFSFGYTLLVGVVSNLIMGIVASRLMLKSISKFNAFRKPWYYGGSKNEL